MGYKKQAKPSWLSPYPQHHGVLPVLLKLTSFWDISVISSYGRLAISAHIHEMLRKEAHVSYHHSQGVISISSFFFFFPISFKISILHCVTNKQTNKEASKQETKPKTKQQQQKHCGREKV